MSYHNNYNGGYRGSGFRNNYNKNGYGFNRNRNNNGYNNNGFDEPRVNETQVPQSKHTIFIRGLHGDTTTEEIKEYIGDKVNISFDFVKVAQDGSKMFVAVRFEKRDDAKEFMETYSNREFMGCRCELSWFRDIRRYCAYQRAKQIRSNSQRRRRRSDSEESQKSSPKQRSSESPVQRRRSRSHRSNQSASPVRSGSESKNSSRSGSPEGKKTEKRVSRKRSESGERRNRSSSQSSGRRSRSGSSESSASSGRSRSSREESRASSRDQSRNESRAESKEDKKSRKPSSESHQKRRRESSANSETKEQKIAKRDLPKIPLPAKSNPSVFIPPPTVDMEIESPPQHVSPYPQHFHSYKPEQNVSYSVPMNGDSPPKVIAREPVYPVVPVLEQSNSFATPPHPPAPTVAAAAPLVAPSVAAPPPVLAVSSPPAAPPPPPAAAAAAPTPVAMPTTPSFVPRQIGRIEIVMPASLPLPPAPPPVVSAPQITPPVAPMSDGGNSVQNAQLEQLPTTDRLFGHLKAFQSALLSTVKFEVPAKKDENDGEITGLRLSSMSAEEDPDTTKAVAREQKMTRLNDDQMMRFLLQKKKIETAFRNDCETYAVVTRSLLSKDESLQFKLKMALLENMEDLYKQFMKRVDDYLDQLLATA